MTLSVCWLLDERADRSVRALWRRLEDAGVGTLLSHTHGRHVPHLTAASLTAADRDALRRGLTARPSPPVVLRFDALGAFPRARCWLAAPPSVALLRQHAEVVGVVQDSGAVVHDHYLPGGWLPHLTLAPRLRLAQLPTVARRVNEVLPLPATLTRLALVDTATGEVDVLRPVSERPAGSAGAC